MSVKKLLVLAAATAGIASVTAAVAGGPDVAPPPPAFQPYAYVEANVGYNDSDWRNFGFSPFASTSSNGSGSFAAFGDIGYMFTKHIGAEFGGGWLGNPRGTSNAMLVTPANVGGGLRVNSWFAYLAGKLSVPVYDNINLFGKAGVAVRWLNWSGAGAPGSTSYWRPMFAVGGEYIINENWTANAQYMRIPGNYRTTAGARRAPAANLWTVGVGYNFSW